MVLGEFSGRIHLIKSLPAVCFTLQKYEGENVLIFCFQTFLISNCSMSFHNKASLASQGTITLDRIYFLIGLHTIETAK